MRCCRLLFREARQQIDCNTASIILDTEAEGRRVDTHSDSTGSSSYAVVHTRLDSVRKALNDRAAGHEVGQLWLEGVNAADVMHRHLL